MRQRYNYSKKKNRASVQVRKKLLRTAVVEERNESVVASWKRALQRDRLCERKGGLLLRYLIAILC